MTFTSFEFLLFFPAVVLLYNFVPQRFRVWFLLAVSYVFYALMQPVYLVLLVAVTGVTYGVTRWIGAIDDENKKRRLMVWGIVLILLPLFFFKYFNFVNESILGLLSGVGLRVSVPTVKWMLPVGISFYTFMAIGYVVDVYNEEVDVEENIGAVGLFLSFFPYILSGPIERAGNIFPQWRALNKSTYEDLFSGFKMLLLGYFMKLCIADRLGIHIDAIYSDIVNNRGVSLVFATLLYPFQVYADLGGYSVMAIGAARCMGIQIIPNFNRPFFATSMSELWRRWHMSLINWLTDYIYTPLSFALRKWKIWGIVCALMLTFLISGLWHGAAFTFIVWGIIQGVYLSVEALLQKQRVTFENKHDLGKKWWYIFLCCVFVYLLFTFSQIFGKASSMNEAIEIIGGLFTKNLTFNFVDKHNLLYGIVSLILLFVYDFKNEFFPALHLSPFSSKIWIVRYLSYLLLVIYILAFGAMGNSQFIYFQF